MSTLYIYPDCKITKERNCLVDNIQAYLQTQRLLPSIEIQYQQIELYKTLKLNMSQSVVGTGPFNYLEIIQDNKSFYYFIDKATWKSTSTVEFELTLDTVNTFSADFSFNKKTKINRQHKDRLSSKLYIDENSIPVYDDYPVGKIYVLANEWNNEAYDTTHLYTDDAINQMTLIRYQNDKITGTWHSILFVGRIADPDTGYYKWQVYDHDGDLLYYSDEQMKADNNNGIYWAIKFDDDSEIYHLNAAWPSLFVGEAKLKYIRLVDQLPEGINPPQFKVEESKITDTTENNWYLVYKSLSADEDSGIDCQLWPEYPTVVKIPAITEFKASDLTNNTYYYIMPKKGLPGSAMHDTYNFKYGNETGYVDRYNSGRINCLLVDTAGNNLIVGQCREDYYTATPDSPAENQCDYLIIYKEMSSGIPTGRVVIECYNAYTDFYGNYKVRQLAKKISNAEGVDDNFFKFTFSGASAVNYYTSSNYNTDIRILSKQWDRNDLWNHSTWNFTITEKYLDSFNSIDRTDTKLVKIIKLPYNFLEFKNNNILIDNNWAWSDDHLYLLNKTAKFITNFDTDFNPVEPLFIDTTDQAGSTIDRKDIYESKIYNSEFYVPKFVYDSFNYQHLLENVDINKVDPTVKNNIEYQATTTINSRFLFKFNTPLKLSTKDYDNLCVVVRNNEVPIYSNSYLNYIRTGYNYDVKNKNAQLVKDTTGVVAGAAGSALALGIAGAKLGAAGGAGAGPIGAVVGAVGGLIIGAATGLINLAINQSQADNNIKQKLDEASRQATTVAGGDDIDLLENYTDGNKAKYVVYRCSDRIKQVMLDLFYYYGYKDDICEVPNLNSRKWFNYIECVPVFNEENNTPYQDYLNDIKERYQAGITVYHRVNDTYDWNQEKENWETNLID